MKTIKYFIGLVAALAFVTVANAQVAARTLGSTPASVATNTTWTTGSASINLHGLYPKATQLGLQVNFKLVSDTGNSNIVFTIQKSIDDSTWDTLGTITKASNGSNTVTVVTNYNVGAMGYFRISQVDNVNDVASGTLTNIVVKYKGN